MGHHRRSASAPGWFGRLIRWWRGSAAPEMQRKADEALWTAKAQRPQVEHVANIVDRVSRNLGRLS